MNGLPCERAKEEFGAIMSSAKLRQERLSLALTIVHDVRVGRFWEAFGNKTKGHVLRNFFGSVEQAMARAEGEFPTSSSDPKAEQWDQPASPAYATALFDDANRCNIIVAAGSGRFPDTKACQKSQPLPQGERCDTPTSVSSMNEVSDVSTVLLVALVKVRA